MNQLLKDENLKELNSDELSIVNGGESLWYWIAYGVGRTAAGVAYVWEKCSDPEMQQQMM